ncbi:DUF7127 family protein [Natronomonas sp. EA1]|uniref:DUF7127 family protein n=1 Tax=Natronomonas sp. EA1 TaxID=3421655 RepID=UPI003EBD5283
MNEHSQWFAQADVLARRYDYEDTTVFVADLGATDDASVDVVDGTAIIVIGDEQYELELPGGEARASINNGVVTVEVSA